MDKIIHEEVSYIKEIADSLKEISETLKDIRTTGLAVWDAGEGEEF